MKNWVVLMLGLFLLEPFALAQRSEQPAAAMSKRLNPPGKDKTLRVAFVLSEDAVMIDFAGPWEVFQDVMLSSRGTAMSAQHPFELYTVANSKATIRVSDGMQVVPDYGTDRKPTPNAVLIQREGEFRRRELFGVQPEIRQAAID